MKYLHTIALLLFPYILAIATSNSMPSKETTTPQLAHPSWLVPVRD